MLRVRWAGVSCTMWPRLLLRGHAILSEPEWEAFARLLVDAGARLDIRDDLLLSTPLGWAVRWGRAGLVALLLERGAQVDEPDAEPWATPLAWARKRGHQELLALLIIARPSMSA
jgi:ankyrin repeat protein